MGAWVDVTLPNIFKFARKLVKCQPCCKRAGYSMFRDSFFSSNSRSIGQNVPSPNIDFLGTSLKYVMVENDIVLNEC